jgi:hypothetical protein
MEMSITLLVTFVILMTRVTKVLRTVLHYQI